MPQGVLGNTSQWLGGYLQTSGMASPTGAYAFRGPTIAVPAVMLASGSAEDSGLVLALNLDDKLSTRLCILGLGLTGSELHNCMSYPVTMVMNVPYG